MNHEKMMKTAGNMYTFVNILEKIVLIGLACIVFGAFLIFLVPEGSAVSVSSKVTLGNIALELYDNALPSHPFQLWSLLITILSGGIICILVYLGLRIIKKILLPMKEGRPFDDDVSTSIKKLGFLVLVGGFVGQAGMYISNFVMMHNFINLMDLFNKDVVKSVTYNASFSLSFVFIALLLYLLAYVFEYGHQLQTQSDETL